MHHLCITCQPVVCGTQYMTSDLDEHMISMCEGMQNLPRQGWYVAIDTWQVIEMMNRCEGMQRLSRQAH